MEPEISPFDEEVEVLKAIFDADAVTYQPATKHTAASIKIKLDTQPPTDSTLSAQLPHDYPAQPPKVPTLRCEKYSAAECALLVSNMLENEVHQGEVCLFNYCQELALLLSDKLAQDGPSKEVVPAKVEPRPLRQIKIFHGEPLSDKKSVFQAHLALIEKPSDINDVFDILHSLNKKVEHATHNMRAYRVMTPNGILQDAEDDGENNAGKCMLFVLEQCRAVGVVCIVSRWFGGILLGPIRFRHIANVVRDILEEHKDEISLEPPRKR